MFLRKRQEKFELRCFFRKLKTDFSPRNFLQNALKSSVSVISNSMNSIQSARNVIKETSAFPIIIEYSTPAQHLTVFLGVGCLRLSSCLLGTSALTLLDELLNPCEKSCYSCVDTRVFCRTAFAITCDAN